MTVLLSLPFLPMLPLFELLNDSIPTLTITSRLCSHQLAGPSTYQQYSNPASNDATNATSQASPLQHGLQPKSQQSHRFTCPATNQVATAVKSDQATTAAAAAV